MVCSKKSSRTQDHSGGGAGINPISPKLRIYRPEAGPTSYLVNGQVLVNSTNENEPPIRLMMSPNGVQKANEATRRTHPQMIVAVNIYEVVQGRRRNGGRKLTGITELSSLDSFHLLN